MYTVKVENRAAAIALTLAVLGVGAALLVVGFALLAGLAVAGGVIGTGIGIYRRLRGDQGRLPPTAARQPAGLDPALEVFPDRPAIDAPRREAPPT